MPARSSEDKIDPEETEIIVNGEQLTYRKYTWVMLNKPAGYLSATEDGRGVTVLDLLPQELQKQGLFPVGRLDKDTEGLLLLLVGAGQILSALLDRDIFTGMPEWYRLALGVCFVYLSGTHLFCHLCRGRG